MLTSEKNRLASADARVRKGIRAHIAWLEKRLQDTQEDLCRSIHASALWREQDEILQSVPGVGPVLSASLLADVPELGRLNRREIAALLGIAPSTAIAAPFAGHAVSWAVEVMFGQPCI
jgi:transposase